MRKLLIVLVAFVVIVFSTGSNCHHGITNPNEPTATPVPFFPTATAAPTTPTSAPSTPTTAPTTPTVPPRTPTTAPTFVPSTPTTVPTAPTAGPTAAPTATAGDPVIANTGNITLSKGGSFDLFGNNLGGCQSTYRLVAGSNLYPLTCQLGDNFSVQLQLPLTSTITPGPYNVRLMTTGGKSADSPYNVTVQ